MRNLNGELKAVTSKQSRAHPSLTPASTPPYWQIIWFLLAAICACLSLQTGEQTEERAHVKHCT